MKPEFVSNQDELTVASAMRGHLEYLLDTWAKPFEVAIATAYFNPAGFGLLADALERVDRVRLLLGAEPQAKEWRVRPLGESVPARAERARVRKALATHERDIAADRDLLGFETEADAGARRLIEWLESGRVEVRRFEEGFLHGKAFLVTTDDEGVVAGSSNFTRGGLATNLELNLGHYQPHVVGQVREWFEGLWEESVPFDLAAVYGARYEPHNPHLVYLRMLYERYGAEVEAEAEAEGMGIHLTQFQRDGVWRAKRILDRYTGVVVADGVGLGKSFIAGELIREAVEDRRQRVLLVSPASLRDGPWKSFLHRFMLPVESVSYDQLAEDRQLNPDGRGHHLKSGVNEYAMVVVDEAHAFRNPDTIRAGIFRKLLAGSPPKALVLLTATPVNNSLWDLYYLLSYFIKNDAAFADSGIRSLRRHFAEAMALDPDDLSPERLFDVLDSVPVRRTRHFVKRYYPSDTITLDGIQVPITFPTPVVHKVDYDLDEVLPGFFDRFAHALDCDRVDCDDHPYLDQVPVLSLARYSPSAYRLDVIRGADEAEAYELQLTGLIRSGLLKRFESSVHAFGVTCRRMADSHDAFLDLLTEGRVATGEALAEWVASDSEDVSEFLDQWGDLEAADEYDLDRLRADVEADRDLLRAFAAQAEKVTPDRDPKLDRLRRELAQIASQAADEGIGETDTRNKRKVIVFSYFADTADWIHNYLEHQMSIDDSVDVYQGRLARITGSTGERSEVLFGFAPESSEAPEGRTEDLYDVLVSTDVLAEGVNLQQARHIINFDLPWNPMRMVQRHGRVDRIGSSHDRVYIRCFFPDRQLDALLGLEERLHAKIKRAAAAVGVEEEILPGSKISDVTFAETRDEIQRLRSEDPTLFETGGETGTAYSGEEYRQELRSGLSDPDLARAVRALPWGSGSGMVRSGARTGFVFCVRIGDHPDPVYRYVDMTEPEKPEIVSDTLACLAHAHATAETSRTLTDEMHRMAYDAWATARDHIHDEWTIATDPANLQPSIPKTMRDAAALVRDHPPPGYDQSEIDELVDSLEAPYGNRIQKLIRDAMRSVDDPRQSAAAVARVAEEQGLQPAEAPEPLPVITVDDIHLVCWQAVAPG